MQKRYHHTTNILYVCNITYATERFIIMKYHFYHNSDDIINESCHTDRCHTPAIE